MVLERMSGTVALSGAINTPGDTGLQPQTLPECAQARQSTQCAARVCQQWNAVSLRRDLTSTRSGKATAAGTLTRASAGKVVVDAGSFSVAGKPVPFREDT
jgi:hypothetical protein